MKRLLLIYLMLMAVVAIEAGDKITVSMVKYYSDSTFELPKKSIEKKMKCVKAAKDDYLFPKMLKDTLNKFQDDDYGNRVFTLLLSGSGKGIKITAKSQDILDNDTTSFFGDLVVDRKHFVIIQNEDNADLLKIFFKKTGDSVIFQRLFVYTHNAVSYLPSSLDAFYDEYDRKLLVTDCVINGENRANKKIVNVTTAEPDTGDDDAFKLDVEFFE